MIKNLLIVFIVLLGLPCLSQKKITQSFDNVSIREILKTLKEEHNVDFAFNKDIESMDKKVSVNLNNTTIESGLEIIFKNTNLGYKLIGTTYTLYEKNMEKPERTSSSPDLKNKEETSNNPIIISGYINDDSNGESIIGAVVSIENTNDAAVSNDYGFYSIAVNSYNDNLVIDYLGYKKRIVNVSTNKKGNLNIVIEPDGFALAEVVVSADKLKQRDAVLNTEMSKISIPMSILNRVPALFGETDVIKSIQLLPGIKRGGEGGLGMYVRGGNNDENLILLDEATVYNPGHLLGFLSVFNGNSLKSTDIFKGAFPSKYGGRLSSVLDIKMREGNDKKYEVQGGIGNISSNLTVEGPILKDKCSFIFSYRRSYIDKMLSLVGASGFPYHFYDLNAKVNLKHNERNRFYASTYLGSDVLDLGGFSPSDTSDLNLGFGSDLGNRTTTLRWNHIYKNSKLFHNLTFIASRFRFQVKGNFSGSNLLVRSAIDDIGLKLDYDYNINPLTNAKFGGQLIHHTFKPNLFTTTGGGTEDIPTPKSTPISNLEMGIYGNLDREIGSNLKINIGARLAGSVVSEKTYLNFEPRFSSRYAFNDQHSLKLGFARMNQYMHLVSGSNIALPTDLWYPSTKGVKPGSSDQINFGYFTFLNTDNPIQLSFETYYKWMYNLLEYREGARLIFNNKFEDELVVGNGRSYGFETMIQKDKGLINGWIGYTLSYTHRTFDEVNNGKEYYARYDRRHDLSVVFNIGEEKHKFGFSAVYVLSTGNPFTPIIGKHIIPTPNNNSIDFIPIYSDRNAYRLNGSSRLDIDFTIKGKKRKHYRGEWHLGAYNVLNRVQPSRVTITYDKVTQKEKYQERGLFGFIASIAYKFKF